MTHTILVQILSHVCQTQLSSTSWSILAHPVNAYSLSLSQHYIKAYFEVSSLAKPEC